MAQVLCIPDLHLPSEHPGALKHAIDIADIISANKIVFLGDIFDLHKASFHDHDPDMPGLLEEIELCREKIKPWIKAFPEATITVGNHDKRLHRVAAKAGIPSYCMKDINEIFGLPSTWVFVDDVIIDDVRYFHGEGAKGGPGGTYNTVSKFRRSCVYGHLHSHAGIGWTATEHDLLFAMNAGFLGDDLQLAFRYGKHFANKGIVGCGAVIDGIYPQFYPMNLGSKIKYTK